MPNPDQVTLNVHLQAAPDRVAELDATLQALLAPTRAEPGCLTYDLHRDPEDPGHFMFYETWRDQAALDAHLARPHIVRFLGRLPALLAAPMQMTKWRKLA